jgi:integrase
MPDLQEIQNYIILCVLSGRYIPPRRSKDYVDFKIANIDKEKDNYIEKKTMVFNSYKTAKTYMKQELPIPIELMKILNKWIKVNPLDYLFFDSNWHKLSNVKLNQRLNKIFGKKASVNQMRHTYLSNKYKDTIQLNKDMAEDMKNMGSSMAQQQIYIKE